VLMIEVGKRAGVDLSGIGMPGHFLVGAGPGVFYDPFHGGALLDAEGCREQFNATRGDAHFHPGYLAPAKTAAIVSRMLANLVHTFVQRDPPSAVWALRLRLRVPGLPTLERRQAAGLLGTLGQFAEAAAVLDSVAAESDGEDARQAEREAASLRSRAN
jgi:regulator of sirC expression with transglutaminase-like and TPR domain